MEQSKRRLLLISVILYLIQSVILIDSLYSMEKFIGSINSNVEFSGQTLFWKIGRIDFLYVQPKLITMLFWFLVSIITGILFGLTFRQDHAGDLDYKSELVNFGLILLVFFEFSSFSYALAISQYTEKPFIISIMALNLYLILPLMMLWYFITESFEPKLVIPKLEARWIAGFFILILYFVYVITLTIGMTG